MKNNEYDYVFKNLISLKKNNDDFKILEKI